MNFEHATPALFAAVAKSQGEVENASKNSSNPHFKSKYADLAEVLNTVRPVFSANGISIIQSTEFDGALVSVVTSLCHAEGGYITAKASCVPAKTDAQGVGSATTYLRRYSLASVCGVAQEDDDGNSAAHGGKPVSFVSESNAGLIKELIEKTDSDLGKVLAAYKVNAITGLTEAQAKDAISRLKQKLPQDKAA